MNKTLTGFFILFATTFCACSSDDDNKAFNPYKEQVKEEFYPTEITIHKENSKNSVTESWQLAYYGENRSKVEYTHTIKDITMTNDGAIEREETSTEQGTLQYYPAGEQIINTIKYTKTGTDKNGTRSYSEETIETATLADGAIEYITRNTTRKDGNSEELLSGEWLFEYTSEKCTEASYTDKNDDENNATYIFDWNKKYKITEIEAEDNNVRRTNIVYKYTYGDLSKDYGFNINAFLFNNIPVIYSALGYLGKTTPYELLTETQTTKEWKDNKWQEVFNGSDTKSFEFNQANGQINIYVTSDNYNIYYINFK